MRRSAAAALVTVVALCAPAGPAAAAGIEPLPANARRLANDVASRATAEEKAWADEAGKRRPLPSYDALKSEVRTKFATHRRMSELEIERLAYLAVVKGFDDAVADYERQSRLVRLPTPTPTAVRRLTGSSVRTGGDATDNSQQMKVQTAVSQLQAANQIFLQIIGRVDTLERTLRANVRP